MKKFFKSCEKFVKDLNADFIVLMSFNKSEF